ncbi:unnamed protein product [Porites evermanni]|uniref:Uncharacterized protein n=1 Tax=Porites evermanni TaxID=104178 RepID=A0ABN8Q6X8_9CNID|nr:unnamed protein product [Porites evermanni]
MGQSKKLSVFSIVFVVFATKISCVEDLLGENTCNWICKSESSGTDVKEFRKIMSQGKLMKLKIRYNEWIDQACANETDATSNTTTLAEVWVKEIDASVGVIVSLSYTGLAEIYSGQFLLGGYKQQMNVSCVFKSTSRPGTNHPSPRLAFYTPDSVMYYVEQLSNVNSRNASFLTLIRTENQTRITVNVPSSSARDSSATTKDKEIVVSDGWIYLAVVILIGFVLYSSAVLLWCRPSEITIPLSKGLRKRPQCFTCIRLERIPVQETGGGDVFGVNSPREHDDDVPSSTRREINKNDDDNLQKHKRAEGDVTSACCLDMTDYITPRSLHSETGESAATHFSREAETPDREHSVTVAPGQESFAAGYSKDPARYSLTTDRKLMASTSSCAEPCPGSQPLQLFDNVDVNGRDVSTAIEAKSNSRQNTEMPDGEATDAYRTNSVEELNTNNTENDNTNGELTCTDTNVPDTPDTFARNLVCSRRSTTNSSQQAISHETEETYTRMIIVGGPSPVGFGSWIGKFPATSTSWTTCFVHRRHFECYVDERIHSFVLQFAFPKSLGCGWNMPRPPHGRTGSWFIEVCRIMCFVSHMRICNVCNNSPIECPTDLEVPDNILHNLKELTNVFINFFNGFIECLKIFMRDLTKIRHEVCGNGSLFRKIVAVFFNIIVVGVVKPVLSILAVIILFVVDVVLSSPLFCLCHGRRWILNESFENSFPGSSFILPVLEIILVGFSLFWKVFFSLSSAVIMKTVIISSIKTLTYHLRELLPHFTVVILVFHYFWSCYRCFKKPFCDLVSKLFTSYMKKFDEREKKGELNKLINYNQGEYAKLIPKELFSYACEHELICIRVKDRLPILLLKLILPLLLLSLAYPAIHAQDSESDVIIGVLITFLATSYSKINDFVNESESGVSTEVADKVVDDYNKKKQ